MKTLFLALFLCAFVSAQVIPSPPPPAVPPSSSIAGQLQTATGGVVNNGTLTFSLSQPALVVNSATLAASTVSCYTSTLGNIVGVPDPLVAPVVSTNTLSGTLAAGTYYVKYVYNGGGGISAASPETAVVLSAQGSLNVNAPAFQPTAASGFFSVYISSAAGTETLQGAATSWTTFVQSTPLVAGSALPASNTSGCLLYFSDSLIPTGTFYTVNLTNKNGSQIAGYPQTWCTFGGQGATINVSQGTPTGNCGTNGVFYPTPIFANPPNGSSQSISGPMSFPGGIFGNMTVAGNDLFTGNETFSGQNSVTLYNLNGGLWVDGQKYPTVQSAITAATSPAVIFVPCGTYVGPTVPKSNVEIFGMGNALSNALASAMGVNPGGTFQAQSCTTLTYTATLTISQLQAFNFHSLTLDFGNNNAGLVLTSDSFLQWTDVLIDRCGSNGGNCVTLNTTGTSGGQNFAHNRLTRLRINAAPSTGTSTCLFAAGNVANATFVTDNHIVDLICEGNLAVGVDFEANTDTNYLDGGYQAFSENAGMVGLEFNASNPGSDIDANGITVTNYSCAANCASPFIKVGQSTGNMVLAQGNPVAPTILGGSPRCSITWPGVTGSNVPTVYNCGASTKFNDGLSIGAGGVVVTKHDHARISTGSINGTTRTEVLLTWNVSFGATTYTAVCSVEDAATAAATQGLTLERIRTKSATQVGAVINNPTGGALTGTLDCFGDRD